MLSKTQRKTPKYMKDIKIFLKKKKKKDISMVRNVIKRYLSIKGIIISHIKNNSLVTF